MPTARPFARNTGAAIAGTTQVGNLAAGTPTAGFAATGLPWWNGPDEEPGYVIATQVAANNQPTPVPPSVTASVGFWRSSALTDASFIDLAQYVSRIAGSPQTFATGSAAYTWLIANGYWTSYVDVVTNGLVMYVDAANPASYPGPSQPGPSPLWYDTSGVTPAINMDLDPSYWATGSGVPTFDSVDGGGSWSFGVFNAGGSTASIPDLIAPGLGFTVGIWIKLRSFTTFSAFTGLYNGGASILYMTRSNYLASGAPVVSIYGSIANSQLFAAVALTSFSTPAVVPLGFSGSDLNQWRYITFTVNCNSGQSIIGYKNGVQQSTATLPNTLDMAGLGTRVILSGYTSSGTAIPNNGGKGSDAKYSVMQIYNRILSASEVLQNFNVQKSRFGL